VKISLFVAAGFSLRKWSIEFQRPTQPKGCAYHFET